MARIEKGNALSTPQLQPGGKFSQDGYGLWTGTLTFKVDSSGSSAMFYRGATCPVTAFSSLKMHKASVQIGDLGIDTWTADYVGMIGTSITNCQVTSSQGLTTDHITSHPNFFTLASGFSGSPIAGVGTGTLSAPKYAANGSEYTGNNGATFEKEAGGKFIGFKKPEYKTLYGKTSYLAPITSFSGHFYTTNSSQVQNLIERVGKTSSTNTFYSIALLPDYAGTTFTNGSYKQLLLAQVNVEDFGTLYKVNYEVRYNRDGYEPSVYAAA